MEFGTSQCSGVLEYSNNWKYDVRLWSHNRVHPGNSQQLSLLKPFIVTKVEKRITCESKLMRYWLFFYYHSTKHYTCALQTQQQN